MLAVNVTACFDVMYRRFRGTCSLIFRGYRRLKMEAAGWAVKLTSLLHLVPRLRLHEAIREFPFCLHIVVLS
jgi:hypothetical protein